MSIVPKDTIHVIAQTIGITNLHDDVAKELAPDVEYRMREIMQVQDGIALPEFALGFLHSTRMFSLP